MLNALILIYMSSSLNPLPQISAFKVHKQIIDANVTYRGHTQDAFPKMQ